MKRQRSTQTGKIPSQEAGIDPREDQNLRAIARILNALRRVDEARTSLSAAVDKLTSEVGWPETPEPVRADFDRFWRARGCNAEQDREWLAGKRARDPVLKQKHLRLVSSQKQRCRARLSRQYLRGPDEAA
jgi:hypothetical protein